MKDDRKPSLKWLALLAVILLAVLMLSAVPQVLPQPTPALWNLPQVTAPAASPNPRLVGCPAHAGAGESIGRKPCDKPFDKLRGASGQALAPLRIANRSIDQLTVRPGDYMTKLTTLAQQAALHNQAAPAEPQIAMLVLAANRQTILEAELRPLSEITAALAAQQTAK